MARSNDARLLGNSEEFACFGPHPDRAVPDRMLERLWDDFEQRPFSLEIGLDNSEGVVDACATEWLAQGDTDAERHDVSNEGQACGSPQRLPANAAPHCKRDRLRSLVLAEREFAGSNPPVEGIKEASRSIRHCVKRFSQRATIFWRRDRRHRKKRRTLSLWATGVGTQRRQHEFAVNGSIHLHLRSCAASDRCGYVKVNHRARSSVGQKLGCDPH